MTQKIRSGVNKLGSQRYKCKLCERRYAPEPSLIFPDEIRL